MRDRRQGGRVAMALATALAVDGSSLLAADPVGQEPVVVTAAPLVADMAVTPFGGNVASVGREQLDGMGAYDLPTALRRVPGVTISRYNLLGAFGGADGGAIYIRGRGTGRPGSDITVYQDGVPRKVGVWDHPLMDVVPVDHAERISVYKGPQPASFGGTFGSVDLASRRRHREGMETGAEASVGEHGTFATLLHHGGKTGSLDYYAGASHRESDGHRPHSGARLQSLYGRIGSAFSEHAALSAQVMVSDNYADDPGRLGTPVPVRDRFATRTVTTSLRMDNESGRLQGFALVYHEDGRIRWDKDRIGGPDSPPGASNTDWENYGFRAWQTLGLVPLNLHAGLEGGSEGGSTENRTLGGMVPFSYEDRYETLMPALAADVLLGSGDGWQVRPSVGLRGYFHNEFDHELAPHAGLVASKSGLTFHASAARGVHYPGVYASGIAAATLDRLEAEILEHVEAGAQWRSAHDGIILGMAAFRDTTSNLLQWTPQGLVNVGRAEVDGLEFSSTFNPHAQLAFFASLTLLDPKAPRTPRVPEWTVSAGTSLSVTPRLQLHADVDAVDRQYTFNGRDGAGARADVEPVDRYVVGNLRMSYRPALLETAKLVLFAGCENIGDTTYESLAGYPLPGRFFSGGARVAF